MQAIRSKDTKPELEIRRRLHAHGFRYRIHARPLKELRRTADIVFTRVRIAVFVDGCFWHGCPDHGTIPVTNADYWIPKLRRNRDRDQETVRILEASGWTVLRYWEHSDPAEVVARIEALYRDVDPAVASSQQQTG